MLRKFELHYLLVSEVTGNRRNECKRLATHVTLAAIVVKSLTIAVY